MGKFTTTGNHSVELKELQLPLGETLRLHLVGVRARVSSDISFNTNSNITTTIKTSPFDGPKGIWVVEVRGVTSGNVTLESIHDGKTVAKIDVMVFKKTLLQLPPKSTQEGLLARLLICEATSPGKIGVYKADDVKKSMLWMRKVIENRLSHKNPGIFNAKKKPGRTKFDVYDIVKAKNQFHGFENYPMLDPTLTNNINSVMIIANNYRDTRRQRYADFVRNALEAASKGAMKGFLDPSRPKRSGLYGWRTKGSGHPGGNFKEYKHFAGQTFYTL